MEQYQKQVEQEVKKFRNEVKKMQESENPYYATPGVLDFEVKQRREALEKKVAEINAKFSAEVDAAIETAKPEAAKSYFRPTETDKRLVDEFVTEFLADAKLSYTESDKLDAFAKLEQKLGYLDENGLHEVRKRLPEMADKLGSDEVLQKKLRGINATLKELRTAEQMKLDELQEQKINGVDWAFRRLRLTHPSYADYKLNKANSTN